MTATIDISQWIDQHKVSAVQIVVAALCALASLLDGFDALIVGYLAPSLIREWHIPPATITPIFVAGLVGILVGCLLVAPLADWFGRKRVLIGSIVAFGIFALISAASGSVEMLSALRFLTGLGLGGALPNALAMTAEFAPKRHRFTMTLLMFIGFPAGASLSGFLAAGLIAHFGWPSVFIVSGVLPLFLAVLLALYLPESIQHLVAKNADPARIAAILRRIDPRASFAPGTVFVSQEEHRRGLTVSHLFRDGRGVGTILLWIIFFASLLDIYLLTSWLPTVLVRAGLSLPASVIAGALVQGGGAVTTLLVGPMIDRVGCFTVLVPIYILGGLATASIGYVGTAPSILMLAAFFSGVGILGGQNTANALAATYYPTYIRATGVGWALGIGRLGAVAGPAIGGIMLGLHWSRESILLATAVPAFVAAVACLIMAWTERGKMVAQRGMRAELTR